VAERKENPEMKGDQETDDYPACPDNDGTVVWQVVENGEWFPVDPPPDDGNCTAATDFVFGTKPIHVTKDQGLNHEAFKKLRTKYKKHVKELGGDKFALRLVKKGSVVNLD
jgi:hypothetical protein